MQWVLVYIKKSFEYSLVEAIERTLSMLKTAAPETAAFFILAYRKLNWYYK
jgi:hypothetical protein